MDAIHTSDLPALFDALRRTFAEQRDFLIALDGKVGDSDLGITMSKAFAAAHETVAASEAGTPAARQFKAAGMAMAKAAPSTMGTLTATGFLRGSQTLENVETIGVPELAAFWRAYFNGVAERGKAKVGDKTLLDVLDPIATSLEGAAQEGGTLRDALAAASRAAEAALERTKSMVAQHGKAAAFQEKSMGLQDAGATVGVLIIQTMRDFVSGQAAA
jgi:phosphoenolpyruvate---glycerone phosphotransferase subunit DhaL